MNLPRVTYSNIGEDFSGVHAHLDSLIPDAEARLLGKSRPAFVDGRDRGEGKVITARSPIDRDIVLGEFPQADAALVNEAVEAARAAFPAWRDLGHARRIALLRAGADVLEQRKWDVSVACLVEVGKSRLEGGRRGRGGDRPNPPLLRRDGTHRRLQGPAARRRCVRALGGRASPLRRVRRDRAVQFPGRAIARDDVGRAGRG